MQQLLDPPQNFNYWNALRDAMLWTNVTAGHYVVGYERNFVLAKNPSSFNSEKNVLLHDACGDRTFGAWGQFYTMVNGVNVSYSRHGTRLVTLRVWVWVWVGVGGWVKYFAVYVYRVCAKIVVQC
jgi:hypothetical protein